MTGGWRMCSEDVDDIKYQLLFGWLNQGGWFGWACDKSGGKEKYIQALAGMREGKKEFGITKYIW